MKLSYISDQRYFLADDGKWYTTASFPLDEMVDGLPGLTKWIFYGRLGRTVTTERLFRLPDCACEVEYIGPWEAKGGAFGYAASLIGQYGLLRQAIRQGDVIWFKLPFIASILGWWWGELQGKLTIAQMVGHSGALAQVCGNKWLAASKLLGWCTKQVYRRVDLPVFVSRRLAEEFGGGRSDVLVCNESRVTERLIGRVEGMERTRIIFVGRLSPEKGVELLLRSFAAIADRYPKIELQLIGDGVLRSTLQSLAEERHVEKRVEFVGYVAWEDVFPLLANGVMVVLPSYTEGLPLVLVEAMSQGVPVVASRVGGIPELVEDGRNGLLFEAGDEAGLTACLEKLLKDRTLCEKLGRAGLEKAGANTFSNQTGRILDQIRQKCAKCK